MPKYINADMFMKKIDRYNLSNGVTLGKHSGVADEIIDMLIAEPAADVVQVVRCKDCKHLMKDIVTEETPYGFDEDRYVFGCRKFFESSGEWVDVMLDDYCSSGESRCHEPEE